MIKLTFNVQAELEFDPSMSLEMDRNIYTCYAVYDPSVMPNIPHGNIP